MCYGVIYKIENKVNGKIYIGQTVRNFDERYRGSIKNTHNEHLKRSIEIYGIENFEIDKCVCKCATKEELDRVEQFYIYVYDAANPEHGYNLTFGGEGGIPNEETKQKISKAQKGENGYWYGKHHSEETKQKMSENIKEVLADPEIKKRHIEGIRKAYENPEVRKKISENVKKALADPEIKKKQSESRKGEKNPMYGKNPEDYMTPEAIKIKREKLSKALKGKYSGKNHSQARTVIQLDKKGNFIRKWDYMKQAEKELNINNISACCRGKCKSAGNYKWMYETDYLDLLQYAF